MSDRALIEEPLQFAEGGRLFGILTLPSEVPATSDPPPVFVFLSAGLLHRVGPSRVQVDIVRKLARMGLASLRVDLSGVGDSPPRAGLSNQQAVAADFAAMLAVLDARLGRLRLVLAGLCAGADNSVRLAAHEPRVVGMLLLDPICFPDSGFATRAAIGMVEKYSNPARYIAWSKRRLTAIKAAPRAARDPVDVIASRDLPTREQLRAAFEMMLARKGRVLSVFTGAAIPYYNRAGQLGRFLDLAGYPSSCTELFWPEVDHTYTLDLHRRRLAQRIGIWAADYVRNDHVAVAL